MSRKKCWENDYDKLDSDCCGQVDETGCRDGYIQEFSEEKCCCERSFYYTCKPPQGPERVLEWIWAEGRVFGRGQGSRSVSFGLRSLNSDTLMGCDDDCRECCPCDGSQKSILTAF